jgi:putative acetyltransferase
MACDQSNFVFCEGEFGAADVQALLSAHFTEMRADSPPEACHVLPADALCDPAIRLFTVRQDGILLGVGALKDLGNGHGELKSMRTARNALGRGVGTAMLHRLLDEARAIGMTRISLETGNSALFDSANRLYAGAGFERCGPFGDYQPTHFTNFYSRAI